MNYLDRIAAEIHRRTESTAWETEAAQPIYRIYAVLALARGLEVTNEDVHNAWAAHAATTWPGHPAIVPYTELSPEDRELDTPYMLVIREVAAQLDKEPA